MAAEQEQGRYGSHCQGCIDSAHSVTRMLGKRTNRCCQRSGIERCENRAEEKAASRRTRVANYFASVSCRWIESHVQAASGKTGKNDIVILKEAREPHRSNLAIGTPVPCLCWQLTIPMQHHPLFKHGKHFAARCYILLGVCHPGTQFVLDAIENRVFVNGIQNTICNSFGSFRSPRCTIGKVGFSNMSNRIRRNPCHSRLS